VWLMQPEVQTTSHGSLAVSKGAIEITIVIQGALEVFWLHLALLLLLTSMLYNQTESGKSKMSASNWNYPYFSLYT